MVVFICERGVSEVSKIVRRVVAVVCCLIGVALVIVGIRMTVPDVMTNADYQDLSKRTRSVEDENPADDVIMVDDTVETDWDTVAEEVPYSVGWLTVGNTIIDYPVVQGWDNDYFLYHDAYGRDSYSSVYLDYRADPDGMTDVIYSHTNMMRMGFYDIAETDEQWAFDGIGTVLWSTPKSGTVAYKPVCALHVYPDYQDIQTFEFEESQAAYESEVRSILARHVSRGEWNTTTIKGVSMLSDRMEPVTPASGGHEHLNYWWSLTEAEDAEAHSVARSEAWKTWMMRILSQSTARASDAEAVIGAGSRTMTLACCSWPFDDHRTLLVCVA